MYNSTGPFNEKCACQLVLTNPSHVSPVAFKMKCTAAKYYASSPAVGVIPPKDSTVISGMNTCLWLYTTMYMYLCYHRSGNVYIRIFHVINFRMFNFHHMCSSSFNATIMVF